MISVGCKRLSTHGCVRPRTCAGVLVCSFLNGIPFRHWIVIRDAPISVSAEKSSNSSETMSGSNNGISVHAPKIVALHATEPQKNEWISLSPVLGAIKINYDNRIYFHSMMKSESIEICRLCSFAHHRIVPFHAHSSLCYRGRQMPTNCKYFRDECFAFETCCDHYFPSVISSSSLPFLCAYARAFRFDDEWMNNPCLYSCPTHRVPYDFGCRCGQLFPPFLSHFCWFLLNLHYSVSFYFKPNACFLVYSTGRFCRVAITEKLQCTRTLSQIVYN